MVRIKLVLFAAAAATFCFVVCAPLPLIAGDWFHNPFGDPCPTEKLAAGIDRLEKHIDQYGSIVAKQPDIWGEARLTKHRQDFETVIQGEQDNFRVTMNAALSRSDQAYLANALAMQAAMGEGTAVDANPLVGDVNSQSIITRTNPSTVSAFGQVTTLDAEGKAIAGIGLEPTVVLDQMARYLYHLNQLRRTNAGDDTADSPGYGLNLIRIPVSVLPGSKTREGYGGEITITAEPYLTNELLPQTFHNLVVNDLTDQLAFPMTRFMNSPCGQCLIKKLEHTPCGWPSQGEAIDGDPGTAFADAIKENLSDSFSESSISFSTARNRVARFAMPSSQIPLVYGTDQLAFVVMGISKGLGSDPVNADLKHFMDVQRQLEDEIQGAYAFLDAKPELWEFCTPELAAAIRRYEHELPDGNSTCAACEFVDRTRECFLDSASASHCGPGEMRKTPVVSLAWAIVVESALLNQQLIDDMQRSAELKGCACMVGPDYWTPFFLPHPPPEACEAFNEYVRCRWPIHVFAVDPIIQEQNVADAFSMRREMQLALSLGFVSGQISAENFTQYARRLELDMETIDLNRTIVGFGHGSNHFGWRLYPRVQSPDTKGHFGTTHEFFKGLKRDSLVKQRRLEPGTRELVALVIMPSFVPFVTIDMRSNWFKLTNPSKKELDLKEALRLSEEVHTLQQKSSNCFHNCDRHRAGDAALVMRSLDQLSARLPLQTTQIQVPYENTLGGFEMFSTGVTDLAPELKGFYGERGYNQAEETTLFVIGNNFSVHDTEVVAGNRPAKVQLLSRQVMKITIPKKAELIEQASQTVNCSSDECKVVSSDPGVQSCAAEGVYKSPSRHFLDVHVATPYGVSNHLLIPAATGKPATPATQEFAFSSTDKAALKSLVNASGGCLCFAVDVYDSKAALVGCDRCVVTTSATGKLCPNGIGELETFIRQLLTRLKSTQGDGKLDVKSIVVTGFADVGGSFTPIGGSLNIAVDPAKLKIADPKGCECTPCCVLPQPTCPSSRCGPCGEMIVTQEAAAAGSSSVPTTVATSPPPIFPAPAPPEQQPAPPADGDAKSADRWYR